MDIMKLCTQLLMSKLGGSSASESDVASALLKLLGGSDGNLDIAGLVSKLASNGNMTSLLSSWMGDGGNESISGDTIKGLFDSNALSGFASQLGVDVDTASNGLADVIPQMIDKSSSGGGLLDSVGGLGGALGMAKKLF